MQEMSRRSGFSEATLRYYERIGLLGPVDRDPGSGHRQFGAATVDRVDALACLRSSGMGVEGMRRYVALLGQGDEAATELRELFEGQSEHLAAEVERLRVRHEYLTLKARLWQAREHGDPDTEAASILRLKEVLRRF
jgi:DNA-binding transcriptional MerR regulator